MRQLRSMVSVLWVAAVLIVPAHQAAAQNTADASTSVRTETNVKLKEPAWSDVLQRLFGDPDKGLLDGKSAFQLRADDVSLTAAQAASFFSSTTASPENLAALIESAAALHGQVRMEGTIDGEPFKLKLAGRELKIEGLTLTASQREALSADLLEIDGLKEAKIHALIDGKAGVIRLSGGRERFELREKSEKTRPERVELDARSQAGVRTEVDRGIRGEAIGRIENRGRIEMPEKPLRGVLGGR